MILVLLTTRRGLHCFAHVGARTAQGITLRDSQKVLIIIFFLARLDFPNLGFGGCGFDSKLLAWPATSRQPRALLCDNPQVGHGREGWNSAVAYFVMCLMLQLSFMEVLV